MFQKDYIIKMIEQLAMAVAAILGSKSKTKIEECHQMVNEALYDLTGLSEETSLKLYYKDIMRLISGGNELNTEKCLALAEMLKLKAEVSKDDSARSFNLYLQSFNIFVELTLGQKLQVFNQSLNEIIEVIKCYEVPRESHQLLFRYYEFAGQYGRAEDVLFKMIIINNKDEMVNEGFAFYERLKGKTLLELEDGNLPLAEVIEGLEVYRHLLNH